MTGSACYSVHALQLALLHACKAKQGSQTGTKKFQIKLYADASHTDLTELIRFI